jgi:diadenylate cyclase
MHTDKVGALIVIEKDTALNEIVSSGTVIDAKISPELVCNVFYPKSPLHDGAMIIRDNKVYAAACIFPLTSNKNIAKELGTRHRAAIGLSESADAVVVVVSEETGKISVCINGTIERGLNMVTLKEKLYNELLTEENYNNQRKLTKFFKRSHKENENQSVDE